ncbi:MAG TPA: ABC transporter permease [Ilumatobacteraceae bacterium]|nr:ABC transporter permease [Ilumatobacteraceae bacterium]
MGRARFGLVAVVVGLIALMATMLSGLAVGLVDDGISGLRRLPLTHIAFQNGADSVFSRSTLDDDNLLPWTDAGVEVSPFGVSFLNARTDTSGTIDIALFGVSPDSFLAPDKQARDALAGPPGIVLSDRFQADGIKVGDTLTIVGADTKLPVLGFTYAGSYGHVDIAFSSLKVWQQLQYGDNDRGRFSAIAIHSDDSSGFAAIDAAAGTKVSSKEAAYAGSPGYSGETQTMTLIRMFLLIISALVVGAFFVIWTVQRTQQIGLLKALGASNSYVIRDAIGQLTLILVTATAVGALVGVGLGQLVGDTVPFRLEAPSVLTTAVSLVGLGLLGSAVALRRIVNVEPIIALKTDI